MICFNCGNIVEVDSKDDNKFYCGKCGPLEPSEVEGAYKDD